MELFNENVERASGKGWVDREMEGNRISGEFPTRLIDSLASASDMPVISVYNSAYTRGEVVVGLPGAPERETTPRF